MPETSEPKRLALLVIGVLLVVAGVGIAGAVVATADRDGISYPAAWAPEVLPYVEIVEDERDLEFEHPIHVEFLPAAAFKGQVTSDRDELTDDDRKEIEQFTGLFRAVGLLEGDIDLFEATNDLSGEGTIGYYSFEDKRIRIRGTELTPSTRSTLVHELTHALQDQHFDLAKRQDAYDESDDTAGEQAFDAIVEGDASRIESAYREGLSEKERAALDKRKTAESAGFEKKTADIPKILVTFMGAPYALGEALLDLALLIDGTDAVDELFRDPPTTDEHLLDPWTLLADHEKPDEVEVPKLEEGEKKFDSGPFGALSWYVVLAERLPLTQALDATDGWGGDSYLGFERGGASCVRLAYRGDTARDLDQMETALRAWIAELPGSPASVERVGDELLFESCDPGTDADVGKDASMTALQLALARTYLAATLLKESNREDVSRCFGDRVVHEFTPEQIADPQLGSDDDSGRARVIALVRGCMSS